MRQSAARLPAMAKAGEFATQAGGRQEAIRRFLADPEAMNNFFTEGNGTVEEFTKLWEGITPKPLEQTSLSPGEAAYGPDAEGTGLEELASRPSAAAQAALEQEKYIPPNVLRELRRMVGLADPSMKERAVAEMIANNPGNPRIRELGIKVRADLIKETTHQDATGRSFPVLIDLMDNEPLNMTEEERLPEFLTQAPPVQSPTASAFELDPADQKMVNVPAKLTPLFDGAERATGLPAGFLSRMASFESDFDPKARGKDGEQGMMQFMPATSKGMGLKDPDDPRQAVPAAGLMVSQLRDRYDGNLAHAIAGYNWGSGNVDKWRDEGADPRKLPERTKEYINFVLGPRQATELLFPEVAQRLKETDAQGGIGQVEDVSGELGATPLEGAFATGAVPTAVAFLDHVLSSLHIPLVHYKNMEGRRALQSLQRETQDYFEKSGRESNEDVQRVLSNLPRLGIMGMTEGPMNAVQSLIELRGVVARSMNADEDTIVNWRKHPQPVVNDAYKSYLKGNILFNRLGTASEQRAAKQKAKTFDSKPEMWDALKERVNYLLGGEEGDDADLQGQLREIEQVPSEGASMEKVPAGSMPMVDLPVKGTEASQDMGRAVKPTAAKQIPVEERAHNVRTEMIANKLSRQSGIPRPIVDFTLGFREKAVETLAIPADVIRTVFEKVGIAHLGRPEMMTEEATVEIMKRDFRRAGYDVDAPATLSATFGGGAFQAAILGAGLVAAAPRIAAIKGEAYVAKLVQKVGSWISKNPGRFTALEAGGGGGAAVGEELADRAGLEGATKVGAAIAGGVVGSGGTNLVTKIPVRMGQAVARSVTKNTMTRAPLRTPGPGAPAVQDFGKAMAATVHSKSASGKGALARFTRQDPDKAIEKIFSGRNPESEMRKIVAATRPDKAASEGIKAGVIDYLFRRTEGDLVKFDRLWSHPANARAINVALGPTTTKRIDSMVTTAKRLLTGDEKARPIRSRVGGGAGQPMQPFSFMGRVIGAQVMRSLGFNTIQATGAGASAAQKAMMRSYEAIFKNIPPEVLFREALLDPKFERMLLSRLTLETKSQVVSRRRMGRAFGGATGALEAQGEE